ncbi:hypothetical protein GN956_G2937 [Arapaima gigas]
MHILVETQVGETEVQEQKAAADCCHREQRGKGCWRPPPQSSSHVLPGQDSWLLVCCPYLEPPCLLKSQFGKRCTQRCLKQDAPRTDFLPGQCGGQMIAVLEIQKIQGWRAEVRFEGCL